MNAFFALTLLAAAVSAQDCPEMPPIECGPEDMNCFGGMDAAGCQMPDICSPMMWGDCPGLCPTFCGPEQMMCPGPIEPMGDCMTPDFCIDNMGKFQMILKSFPILVFEHLHILLSFLGPPDMNGDDCANNCPTFCMPEEIFCSGGMDETGCLLPDFCMPMGSECPMPSMPM